MKIAENAAVSIHYTLTNDTGEVLDSSQGQEPLAYVHGNGQIIPGLEAALEGKEAGDMLQVTIAPEDAYGPRHEELIQPVPREAFQGDRNSVMWGVSVGSSVGRRCKIEIYRLTV